MRGSETKTETDTTGYQDQDHRVPRLRPRPAKPVSRPTTRITMTKTYRTQINTVALFVKMISIQSLYEYQNRQSV